MGQKVMDSQPHKHWRNNNITTIDNLPMSVATVKLHQVKNQMGVSENSVPLNPMVNDHYPY